MCIFITFYSHTQNQVDALYNAIPDSFNGRVIGTDTARELSEEYAGWEGVLMNSAVTSTPASAYAQDRFRREICKPQADEEQKRKRVLVLTAGGPSSGKTSVVRGGLIDGKVDLVMDQNLGKHSRAVEQIELALSNNWYVRVVYVFKPFDLIAPNIIRRAQNIGRWSPLSCVGHAHRTAQSSVLKLYDKYKDHPNVSVELNENLHTKTNPVPAVPMRIEEIQPGGKYHLEEKVEWMDNMIIDAIRDAKSLEKNDLRLMAALEFGANPAKANDLGVDGSNHVHIMSKYHKSTHMTDRILIPDGVLKLSSGDCKDLINVDDADEYNQLLAKIDEATYCKVTWGTSISRRLERISQVIEKHPKLDRTKLYPATPYEEVYSTAISCKMHENVKDVMVLVAFGGSCLHVITVNQDDEDLLLPGHNSVSKGLSQALLNVLVQGDELIGTKVDWIDGHTPPLPSKGTFYTTFSLDSDLDKREYMMLGHLFEELNALLVEANGMYLICGAPTNINPNNEEWWPDKSPRAVQTTLFELARYSAQPQVKNAKSGINRGGLLSDRHKVSIGGSSTTVHEMVLSVMAAPHLAANKQHSQSLPGLSYAHEYFQLKGHNLV